jgi:hypothetical protein
MTEIIQRQFRIQPGVATSGRETLGNFNEKNPNELYKLRAVRVGSFGLPYDEHARIQATLTMPGGCEVGPIDVPFTFNCALPVTINWATLAQSEQVTCIATAADLPDPPNLLGATYFIQGAGVSAPMIDKLRGPKFKPAVVGPTVQIPYWVVAVTVYSGDTATWYDSTSTAIGTVTGPLPVAKPREAVALSTAANSSVLFHY